MLLLAGWLPAFQPAGVTGFSTAVSGFFTVQGILIFLLQESSGYSHVNMSPGE